MSIILDGTTGITTPDLIDSSLTSGRVVYAGASGNLAGSSGLVFDSAGNFGLGTASPTASASNRTLTINGPATFGSLIDFKSNETLNLRIFSGVANSVLSVKTATPLTFETNDIERGRFDSAGEFLLGTTSAGASQRLAIVGAETLCMMKNTSATSSTQRTTILFRDNGDNSVGTLKTSTAGINLTGVTGITFPATQSASSDANTLDDYEEGTWSPVLAPSSSGSITMNGSFTSGKYTKVGRLVVCTASLYVSSVSSPTGNLFITGLPFTVLAPSSAGSFWGSGMTSSANNSIVMRISSSSTEVLVQGFASGAVVAAAPWVQAATEMNVTLTYFV